MDYYAQTNFLQNQQIEYIDSAIKYASSKEREEFFEKQKSVLIKGHAKVNRKRVFENVLLATLLVGTFFVVLGFAIWVVLGGWWS